MGIEEGGGERGGGKGEGVIVVVAVFGKSVRCWDGGCVAWWLLGGIVFVGFSVQRYSKVGRDRLHGQLLWFTLVPSHSP